MSQLKRGLRYSLTDSSLSLCASHAACHPKPQCKEQEKYPVEAGLGQCLCLRSEGHRHGSQRVSPRPGRSENQHGTVLVRYEVLVVMG